MPKLHREILIFAFLAAAVAGAYFLPVDWVGAGRLPAVGQPLHEALALLRWYAREHLLLCLVPAFFIAGAVATFVSQQGVMRYLGAAASKVRAYAVASVSGGVLAVCSCTVLPLFSGIYRMGAGLGPAVTFLYAGPAVNVLAILLTGYVLGWRIGLARALGAVGFSILIGLAMHAVFRRTEGAKAAAQADLPADGPDQPLWRRAATLAMMVLVLVFANFSATGRLTVGIRCCPTGSTIEEYIEGDVVSETPEQITLRLPNGQVKAYPRDWVGERTTLESPLYLALHRVRFLVAGAAAVALAAMLLGWFPRRELAEWVGASWGFAKQILPLLFGGVLLAGFLLGRPGHEGLIPSHWIGAAVGGESLRANVVASLAGALMYFATLTEVPIVEGLRGSGMGDGPAVALLLAGPALSLPSMLVIRSVLGTRKTVVYIALVVVAASASGVVYGALT